MIGTGTELLAAHRDELNARFAREAKELPPEVMLGYLGRTVVPILDAWVGEPTPALLFALFELGLVGIRVGVIGALEMTPFEHVLRERMPVLGAHVAGAPSLVLRALGNGFLQVQRERGPATAQWWLESVTAGAARCADRAALFDLGLVAGWRAGLAEARRAALESVGKLEPALVEAVLGAAVIDATPTRRFCKPGARGPLGPLELIATAGGFVGFGGPFSSPPRPRVVAERLVCTDGTATFELFADVFGTRFRPAMWAHADAATTTDDGGARLDGAGVVHGLGGSIVANALRGAVAVAECEGVIAVVLGDSHKVLVVGRREAAP